MVSHAITATCPHVTTQHAATKAQRIHPPQWIIHIGIGTQPARQTNRIQLSVTPACWVVVAECVVVQDSFVVQVLSLKA